jgi:PEP-CTERM motif
MIFSNSARLLFAAFAVCAAANAAAIFNFDTDNSGTSTTFTDTSHGLSATFSSSADPGGFVLEETSFFDTLTGNVLGDPGPAGQDNLTLDINFSQNLSAITLDFATTDFDTPSPFTLTAYENSTPVGSNTLAGQFLPGFLFPEGEISFGGAAFNNVVLSSPATDFAVDNIAANPSAAPEPGTLALLGVGLVIAGMPRMRRRLAATR